MELDRYLALELASTIRHDGHGGVADDLADVAGLTSWVRDRLDLLDGWGGARDFAADEACWAEVVAVRAAVRALFARAVRPGPPSPADARRLLPVDEALARVNAAASGQPVVPRLDWPSSAAPSVRLLPALQGEAAVELSARLARAAINFLAGPERERLRACTAPRCVRYFLKDHGRQEWCKPSCGNRARAARHYQRHRQ
ncbi:CGNR zinc finger domain-containing protein [Actinopolymorpha alba]|uniref:CGNR zinc finger domain-containing protein n=1 Tax=Actinopolymorpha alba TaxID=533267 RepID=UPI00037ADFDC|nr:CGNR zinc finger domain-containing protein [Actinopolymorpha alba]